MKKIFTVFLSIIFSFSLFAQTSITGRVTIEDTGEELIGAIIQIEKNSNLIATCETDFNGIYSITIDVQGAFDVRVSHRYTGIPENLIKRVEIQKCLTNKLDIAISKPAKGSNDKIVVKEFKDQLQNIYSTRLASTACNSTISAAYIRNLPTRKIQAAISGTTITGKITDKESGEELIGTNIVLKQKGVFKVGTITDFNGNYKTVVNQGTYDVEVTMIGYPKAIITNVIVKPNQENRLCVALDAAVLDCVIIKEYKIPIINVDNTTQCHTITAEKNSDLTTRNVIALASSAAGISATDPNQYITVRGSRVNSTQYYIDGLRVNSKILNPSEKNKKKPKLEAGILTAGEWNALEDWEFWEGLLKTQNDRYQKSWQFFPSQHFSVMVTNLENIAIPNCTVKLQNTDGTTVWESKTDNEGNAELWANLFGEKHSNFTVIAEYDGITTKLQKPLSDVPNSNKIKLPVTCKTLKNLYIAFVVDATASMRDEINYLKAELQNVIYQVREINAALNIRTASVFYRDQNDEYVTRSSPFTQNINETIEFISDQKAAGGGDYPEAVNKALEEVLNMEWSENAVGKILFLVLDAPPHNNPEVIENLQKQIRKAAALGVRIIPIAASGISKSTEFLMKSLAMTTNGTYVFITDHSGIGNPHLKATVSDYNVEMLNELIIRLISDFSTQKGCDSSEQIRKRDIAEGADLSSPLSGYLNQLIYFYPNPADSKVMIELKEDFTSIKLINVMGKTVKTLDYPKAGFSRISVSDFPAGTYLLQFQKGSELITKRLVVAKP